MIRSQFWSGTTGKAITIAGKDTRILATYLLTCEHANMLGLYRLPILYIAEETGLKRKEVLAALENLKAIGFAHYDDGAEFVWVIEMARFQLDLSPGEALNESDHRVKGVMKIYKQLAKNPFLGPFYDRYASCLHLSSRREFLSELNPPISPLEAPSEPLVRGDVPVPDHVHDRNRVLVDREFEKFWTHYPMRNGKRIGRPEAVQKWNRLKADDRKLVLIAVQHYASSKNVLAEIGIKDPHRWLRNGKDDEPWREWIEPEQPSTLNGHASALTCSKRVQKGQFLKACGAPVDPHSRPTEPRCTEHLTANHSPQEVAAC